MVESWDDNESTFSPHFLLCLLSLLNSLCVLCCPHSSDGCPLQGHASDLLGLGINGYFLLLIFTRWQHVLCWKSLLCSWSTPCPLWKDRSVLLQKSLLLSPRRGILGANLENQLRQPYGCGKGHGTLWLGTGILNSDALKTEEAVCGIFGIAFWRELWLIQCRWQSIHRVIIAEN